MRLYAKLVSSVTLPNLPSWSHVVHFPISTVAVTWEKRKLSHMHWIGFEISEKEAVEMIKTTSGITTITTLIKSFLTTNNEYSHVCLAPSGIISVCKIAQS